MSGINPNEAHRVVYFQGKEKRMRTCPLAGDTDNDASYDQDEPEEMAVEQSSQVPVTPSVHQTTLSSLRIKANPTNVACQLLELSEEQLQEFAASRNTRKFAPIISKLICFQMSLTERFETLRLEEERVPATPAKPVSQMLLSPLVPATSPQPSDAPASEVWITPQQMPAPTVMRAAQNSAPLQVDVEDETVRVATATKRPLCTPRGGQEGPRKQHAAATRKSNRTAPVLSSPEPVRGSARIAENDTEPVNDRPRGKTADKKVKQYRSHRQCFDKTPAGGSYLPEPIRLVERDSIIDLTELPSVEMVSSAAEDLGELECSALRCFKWTGHCPPSAALSVPSALGRWKCPPARQGASQKPGSGPVHSLTLDGPIESRYQYFTRQ